MKINANKARKLIDELEKTLNETANQTGSARQVLGDWLNSGEAKFRKKSADALRQVRKRADRFTTALAALEMSLSKSLEKLSERVEATATEPSKKETAKKETAKKGATKKTTRRVPARKTAATAKKTATA